VKLPEKNGNFSEIFLEKSKFCYPDPRPPDFKPDDAAGLAAHAAPPPHLWPASIPIFYVFGPWLNVIE